jgi:serine protease Do
MNGQLDATDVRRATTAPRRTACSGMFAAAAVTGAAVGLLAAHALISQPGMSTQLRSSVGPSVAVAQPLAPPASAPAGFADVVEVVKPAVIGVRVRQTDSSGSGGTLQVPPEPFSRRSGPAGSPPAKRILTTQGSGFFISADGYAVTNNHVVDGNGSIEIRTDNHKTYPARVIGADSTTDLALLKVDGRSDFSYAGLADRAPRVGDWVLAIGNPFGLGGTVTAGIVSARERDIGADASDRLIQIDAPINKGDSGGPSFDLQGRVIGVNTMIFSPSGGSIGIAFAIPADTVKTVIAELRDKGAIARGWLGVQVQPVTPEIASNLGLKVARGALIAEPQADSPAASVGIEPGDVITSIDGAPINDARELSKTIGGIAPGTTIKLGMQRRGEEKTLTVTLGQLPSKRQASGPVDRAPGAGPAPNSERETTGRGALSDGAADAPGGHDVDLGLKLAPAETVPGAGKQGVVVTDIDPTGLAADEGVEIGDVILEVAGRSVNSPGEIHDSVRDARREGKPTVLLRLKSGETARFVALPIG